MDMNSSSSFIIIFSIFSTWSLFANTIQAPDEIIFNNRNLLITERQFSNAIPGTQEYEQSYENSELQLNSLSFFTFIPEQLYAIRDLNLDAQRIWQIFENCHPQFETRINNYLNGNINCNNEYGNFKSELNLFKTNVSNYLKTTVPDKYRQSGFSAVDDGYNVPSERDFQFPIIHPLLGQILIEYIAHIRTQFINYRGKHSTDIADQEDMMLIHLYCLGKGKRRSSCENKAELIENYFRIRAVLRTSRYYCQNYGFNAIASLYAFHSGKSSIFYHPLNYHGQHNLEGASIMFPENTYEGCWQNSRETIISNFIIFQRHNVLQAINYLNNLYENN